MKFTTILLASAMSAIAVSGQNLVINGSFEQGTNGWTFLGSWAIESGRAVIADTGTNFATSLEGNVQPAYQDVPTVPGQIYRINAAPYVMARMDELGPTGREPAVLMALRPIQLQQFRIALTDRPFYGGI